MTTHLTDDDLVSFRAGTLAADGVLRVDDHLAICAGCRRRAGMLGAGDGIDGLRAGLMGTGDHLSDEDVQSLLRMEMTPEAAAAAEQHLAACPICATQVDDLRAWAQLTRSAAPRRRLAIAAAILVAAMIPAAIWQARRSRAPVSEIAGLAAVDAATAAYVQAAVNTGTAEVPPFLTELNAPGEVLMGPAGATAEAFRPISPLGTSTLIDRPEFTWQPLPGSSEYRVRVFDEQGNLLTQSATVAGPTWTPAAPLPRGATYVWQVTAKRGREELTTPSAPAPRAAFHVVDAVSTAMLQRLSRDHPQAHLLLGILYMHAGVVEAAVSHFRAVPSTDPHADVARRSLQRLDRLPDPATRPDRSRSRE